MTAGVTIPAELAAEVETVLTAGGANETRFRPAVEPDAEVLNLLAGDVCRALAAPTVDGLHVVRAELASSWLEAWALVGSVDGGPRPEVGQRVLILGVSKGYPPQLVGRIGEVTGGAPVYVRIPSAEVFCYITRWALLPELLQDDERTHPGSESVPSPASPGGSGDSVPADRVSPNPHRKPLTARCQLHSTPYEPATRLAVVQVATEGGDRSRELFVCDACAERLPADPEPTDAVEGPPARPVATRGGKPVTCILGDYVVYDTGRCNCATGPNGEHEPHCGLEPLVHVAELRALGFVRAEPSPGDASDADNAHHEPAASVPARPWRVGTSWGVTLVEQGTGEPDEHGRRRDDRLVGMCREEADAALVVDAVNAYLPPPALTAEDVEALQSRPLPPALAHAGVEELRDHIRFLEWQRERRSSGITRSELLAARAERDRYRDALRRIARDAPVVSGEANGAARANEWWSIAREALEGP